MKGHQCKLYYVLDVSPSRPLLQTHAPEPRSLAPIIGRCLGVLVHLQQQAPE